LIEEILMGKSFGLWEKQKFNFITWVGGGLVEEKSCGSWRDSVGTAVFWGSFLQVMLIGVSFSYCSKGLTCYWNGYKSRGCKLGCCKSEGQRV
jgi:hypothetical protein